LVAGCSAPGWRGGRGSEHASGEVIVVGQHPTVCEVVEEALVTAGFDVVPPGAAADMATPSASEAVVLVFLTTPLAAESDREHHDDAEASLRIDDVVVDPACRTARRGPHHLDLGRREFDALAVLIRNQPRVVTKQFLLDTVWDYGGYDPNVVEVAICSLRRKLESHGPRVIQTVRGLGYSARLDS
jgi:hypothetical protein